MKHSDLQHCNSDLAAPMKHSLQLRSGLLLLLLAAACTILCFRADVRRADLPLFEAAVGKPFASFNATLLRLASVDVGAEDLRKDLEQLLDGRSAAGDPLHRTFASWRRFHHDSDNHLRSPLWRRPNSGARLLRSPRDDPLLPEFRRLARDWLGRRRSHPDAVPPLLDLVKRPLDLHRDPSSPAPTRRYASCAVVGNSGILLQSNRGDLIDAHDLVIRLNNARTQGYERNVGSRTGLAFINSNILHLCARREACPCHPYGDGVPVAMYVCQAAHLLDYAACNASHRAPLLVTDPRFDRLCARIVKYYSLRRFAAETGRAAEEWDQAHDAKLFHYSSGMQAVVLALGMCDRVGVFGFGKSAAAKHHYHTNQKAELSLHDYEAEYAFYGDLADRPQVIPFLAEAGISVPPVVLYH